MSKDKKTMFDKELRLMEVTEDTTSMSKQKNLKDKIIMPPAWDLTADADEIEETSTTLH